MQSSLNKTIIKINRMHHNDIIRLHYESWNFIATHVCVFITIVSYEGTLSNLPHVWRTLVCPILNYTSIIVVLAAYVVDCKKWLKMSNKWYVKHCYRNWPYLSYFLSLFFFTFKSAQIICVKRIKFSCY